MLDLSLFRHAPHALKPGIYRDQQWLFQQRIASRRGPEATAERPFGDVRFLREFATRVTVADAAPVYTLVHVLTPHVPVVTDADCNYGLNKTPIPEDYANQARCALSAVQALFDRLRALDLYDRSAIIVTSDHGEDLFMPEDQHPMGGMRSPAGVTLAKIEPFATPLLLVKPFAAQGPLQTSYAPTSITDIPATCSTSRTSRTVWDLARLYFGSIPTRPGTARTHTTTGRRNRLRSTMPSTCSRSTGGATTQTPGAITGRYSGLRMIVQRNAESFRSVWLQIRMTQQISLALASTGPTDTRSFTRRPKTRPLRSMSEGCRPWPPPRR